MHELVQYVTRCIYLDRLRELLMILLQLQNKKLQFWMCRIIWVHLQTILESKAAHDTPKIDILGSVL